MFNFCLRLKSIILLPDVISVLTTVMLRSSVLTNSGGLCELEPNEKV